MGDRLLRPLLPIIASAALAVPTLAAPAQANVAAAGGQTAVRGSLAPPAAAPGPGWSAVPTRNLLTRTGQFTGVSCPSSSSCTAVGDFTKGSGVAVILAEHWDGSRWAIQATPNPRGARLSVLASVSCSSRSACTAVGQAVSNQGASTPLAERWDGTRWRIQATPNPPQGGGGLSGVSCTSASSCFAVGSSNAGTLAEHWNGTTWRIQRTPSPSGAPFSFLNAVSCTSSSACSAVGGYGNSSGTPLTLAERWNGTRWTIQATANPSGSPGSLFIGVSCTSASACTAVGARTDNTGTPVGTLAERWNGARWSIQATPNPSGAQGSFLNAVSCMSASACTAVGARTDNTGTPVGTLAERWDGRSWHIQPTPNPAIPSFAFHLTILNAVSCTSASACTTVGSSMTSLSTPVTLAERWNGTTWAIQATPNRPGAAASGLFGVACTAARSCMAVGGTSSPNDIGGFLAERWDGTRWSILPTPALPPGALMGVSCTSPAACTAVGQTTNSAGIFVALAERWNGTTWRVQPTPNPGGAQGSAFGGVSCPTASFCMAIGSSGPATPHPMPLAERWNGTTWKTLPIPAPAGAQGVFIGPVSCTSTSACTTTGLSMNSSGLATTLAERWNGTAWRIQPTPNPPGAQGAALPGIACTGPSACLAVGASNPFTPNAKTLAEQWDGTRWRIVPSPNPAAGGGGFSAVSCASPSACTGVGASNSGTLAERWNGTRWTIQPTPNPVVAFQIFLDSVACPARRFCTAVGDYGLNATGAERLTLGLQWRDTGQGPQLSAAPPHPASAVPGLLPLSAGRFGIFQMPGGPSPAPARNRARPATGSASRANGLWTRDGSAPASSPTKEHRDE